MKNLKLLLGTFLGIAIFILCTNNVCAASGIAHIHYYNESGVNRVQTYDLAKGYLQDMGYEVRKYDHYGMGTLTDSIANHLMGNSRIFVVHNHGTAGIQYTGSSTTGTSPRIITGNNLTSPNIIISNGLAISKMDNGALNNLKMVILYGCHTGEVTNDGGNLPAAFVKKGATAAVAWKVNTLVSDVNEWNRLFFEKTTSDTIVEGFRHADYWLEYKRGTQAANIMKNNRNEQGNIYAYIK